MNVSAIDFIKSPSLYLERVKDTTFTIIQDGNPIAVLAKPSATPITDSLLGLLKDSGIKGKEDIKEMRLGT